MLLKYNADEKARDQNWLTPGHIAAAHNAVGCMELLMANVSNVNSGDKGGRSGLHHAAHLGNNTPLWRYMNPPFYFEVHSITAPLHGFLLSMSVGYNLMFHFKSSKR